MAAKVAVVVLVMTLSSFDEVNWLVLVRRMTSHLSKVKN